MRAMALGVLWEEARMTFAEFGKITRRKGKSWNSCFQVLGRSGIRTLEKLREGKFHSGILGMLGLLVLPADIVERILSPSFGHTRKQNTHTFYKIRPIMAKLKEKNINISD